MNARSDIVFQINADVKGIVAGSLEAGASLRDMDKLVQVLDKSTRQLGQGNTELRARIEATTGVMNVYNKSARDSARAFDEAFRAQERTAAAATRMKTTTVAAADATSEAFQRASGVTGQMRGNLQNLGYQLQDIAVQLQGGQNAALVFAQQGSQILSVFGPVGVMLGVMAAVTVPALSAAFGSGTANAKSFSEAISAIEAAQSQLDAAVKNFTAGGLEDLRAKYGEINQEVLNLIENQRIAALEESLRAARDAAAALAAEFDGGLLSTAEGDIAEALGVELSVVVNGFREINPQVRAFQAALQEIQAARSLDEQADATARLIELMKGTNLQTSELFGHLVNAEAALRQMAAAAPQAGWLGAAISEAATLASTMAAAAQNAWAAANAANSAPGTYNADGGMDAAARGAISRRGMRDSLVRWQSGQVAAGRGGGGGGGGADPFEQEFLKLQESLKSQADLELEAFAERQKVLDEALAKRQLSMEEHAALMEQLQQQHQEKMTAIDAWRYGDGLTKAESFFGGMADALSKGNEKMARAAKVFGAAEALINAWRAHNQTLADPSLPFFAKIPAALSVLGAGLGAASAIKGGGGGSGSASGGGGGGAASAASAAASQGPLQARLTGFGPNDFIRASELGNVLDQLGQIAGDRGLQLFWPK